MFGFIGNYFFNYHLSTVNTACSGAVYSTIAIRDIYTCNHIYIVTASLSAAETS